MNAENADPYRRTVKVVRWMVIPVLALFFVLALSTGAQAGDALQYTVQPGDSLWRLSARYDTSISEIQGYNSLPRTTIYIDETLDIPYEGPVHVVSDGETLYRIAGWYGVTVEEIQRVNRHHTHLIYPGQRLAIPVNRGDATAGTNGSTSAATNGSDTAYTATSHGQGAVNGTVSSSELDLLARLVHSESEGEVYEGKVAVAAVVLNRMESHQFPSTASGVIYDSGQFEPVMNGTIYQPADASAHRAVQDALSGWDPSWGALYFFNPAKTSNVFMWSRPVIRVIGNHRFTH